MASITTRAGKGAPLTNAELDANFNNLNAGLTTNAAITGGTINGTVIGETVPSGGAFTTIDATTLEVTNIRAKDGTAAGSIANSTGVVTFTSVVFTTADINGGTADSVAIGATAPSTGAFTTLTASGNVTFTSTGHVKVPAGTSAQRSGSPTSGMLRYNTDLGQFEGYSGSSWGSIGGVVSQSGSSLDNAIVRFSGTTGSAIQNSGVTIDDNNILTFASGYTETVAAISGTTTALDIASGTVRTWSLTANSTVSAINLTSGQSLTLMVLANGFGISWPAGVVTWLTFDRFPPFLEPNLYHAILIWNAGGTVYGTATGR